MLARKKGKFFQALPMLGLLLLTILFHVLVPFSVRAESLPDWSSFGGKIMDALVMTLVNFGVGMLVNGIYLKWKKGDTPEMHLIPGIFSLLVAALIFFMSKGMKSVTDSWGKEGQQSVATQIYLLELGEDDQIEELAPLIKQYELKFERAFPSVSPAQDADLAQYYLLTVPVSVEKNVADLLLADKENVDSYEPNLVFSLDDPAETEQAENNTTTFIADDPLLPRQWYAEKLNYNAAFELLQNKTPRRKAKVAILDTGVDGKHEDLDGIFGDSPAHTDKHGHGTHCAGLAGAATNNHTGVASLNWEGKFMEIRAYAALGDNGSGNYEQIAQAVVDATQQGADVISMSLGGPALFTPKVLKDAIKFALKQNAIVVVAAGNENVDAKTRVPANIEGVICVSAVNPELRKAAFSNTNTSLKMPIAAPGTDIFSLVPANQYRSMNGTSMATPLVAGLLGVMRSLKPELSAPEAYQLLQSTGISGADAGKTGKVIHPKAVIEAL